MDETDHRDWMPAIFADTQSFTSEIADSCKTLREHHLRFLNNGEPGFCVGDLIKWKPGLRNRYLPEYGQPAIVTCFHRPTVYNLLMKGVSSRENPNLVVGYIDDDGEFFIMLVERCRFEPFSKGAGPSTA